MKFLNIKQTYLLFIIVIGLVSLSVYSTYALFTATSEIENVVNITTSLQLEGNIIEYEMVTIPAGETKIMELNVTNTSSSTLYYGAWYQMVNPTSLTDDIELGLYTEENNTPGSGTIAANTKLTLLAGISNDSSSDIIVNVGVAGSIDNNLNLSNNKVLFPTGWVDAIFVTNEYLQDHTTTTTETVSEEVNLSYTTVKKHETVLQPGTYKLTVYGASGGNPKGRSSGAAGGYSYGTLTLSESTTVYIYVGGQGNAGTSSSSIAGGFNGGGNGRANGGPGSYDDTTFYSASGGGASDVRIGTDSLYARVIVAGGGGGTGGYLYNGVTYLNQKGGAGGGTTGGDGNGSYVGTGATASKGGIANESASSWYATDSSFGNGGGAKSSSKTNRCINGGGGGWYGGGFSGFTGIPDGAGGGSGYVYTSSTASQYPSGCLLSSKYYLTNARTSTSSHTGNGTVIITGTAQITTEVVAYTIPYLTGLTGLTISSGTSINLTNDVELICENGGNDCSIVKTSITDTSILSIGSYTIYYIVKDSNGNKYKYSRNLIVN